MLGRMDGLGRPVGDEPGGAEAVGQRRLSGANWMSRTARPLVARAEVQPDIGASFLALELHRLATDYQRELAKLPGLDAVLLRWPHLTMQNAGFTDEMSEADAHAVLDEARSRCAALRAFEVMVDEAEVRGEGVALRPDPADPVCQVRDAVRAAIASVRGEAPEAPEHAHGFRPACQPRLRQRGRAVGAGHRRDRARGVGGGDADGAGAKLIVLDRDEGVYRWTTFGNVPLGLS